MTQPAPDPRLIGTEYKPLNPDPLDVTPWDQVREAATWQGGYDDGYEQGLADALPRIRVLALAAFAGLLLGILIAVSATGALR